MLLRSIPMPSDRGMLPCGAPLQLLTSRACPGLRASTQEATHTPAAAVEAGTAAPEDAAAGNVKAGAEPGADPGVVAACVAPPREKGGVEAAGAEVAGAAAAAPEAGAAPKESAGAEAAGNQPVSVGALLSNSGQLLCILRQRCALYQQRNSEESASRPRRAQCVHDSDKGAGAATL